MRGRRSPHQTTAESRQCPSNPQQILNASIPRLSTLTLVSNRSRYAILPRVTDHSSVFVALDHYHRGADHHQRMRHRPAGTWPADALDRAESALAELDHSFWVP